MAEKLGIQETKEVLEALNEVSLLIIKLVKDGVQMIPDTTALVNELLKNDELKAVLGRAKENITKVPAEIKDIDFAEGMQLGMVEAQMIPKIVEALKK